MALNKPQGKAQTGVAQSRFLEPHYGFTEICDAGIDPACPDFSIAAQPLRHRGIEREGSEGQCVVTALHFPIWISLLNVRSPHAIQADHLESEILESCAVFESTPAVPQALVPIAEGDRRRAQM